MTKNQPDTYTASVERQGAKAWLAVWHNDRTGERHFVSYPAKTRKAALETAQVFADQAHQNDVLELKAQLETLVNAKPETGEQWAAICQLEQQIADAATKPDFVFHTDNAHGWLEVDWTELKRLSLNPSDFSKYSYRRGNTFFLEEDRDATKFLLAWEAKHKRKPVFDERHQANSFIRDLERVG